VLARCSHKPPQTPTHFPLMKQFFSRGSRTPRGNSQSPDAHQPKPDVTLSANGAAGAARSSSRLGPSPPPPALQAQKAAEALEQDNTPRLGQQQQHRQHPQQQQQPAQREAVNTGSNYVPALALTPRGGRGGNTPRGSRRDSADRRRSARDTAGGRQGGGGGGGGAPGLGRNSSSGGSSAPEAPGSGEISARGRSHPQVPRRLPPPLAYSAWERHLMLASSSLVGLKSPADRERGYLLCAPHCKMISRLHTTVSVLLGVFDRFAAVQAARHRCGGIDARRLISASFS